MIFNTHTKHRPRVNVVSITMLPKTAADASGLFEDLKRAGFSPRKSLFPSLDFEITLRTHKTSIIRVARIAQRYNCIANVTYFNQNKQ